MSLPEPDWRRLAAELVLDFHKTPGQAARICGCSIPVVQQCVAAYVRQCTTEHQTSTDDSVFIPVVLEEESSSDDLPVAPASPSMPLPVEIVTPSGLIFRVPLTTLDDIALLFHSLEAKPC